MQVNGNLVLNNDGSGTFQYAYIEKFAGGVGGGTLPAMVGKPGGRIIFNTSDNYFYYWNGTTWISFASGTTSVATFQTSLSGLTPQTATTGAVTLAGTLGAASGGTGQTTYTTGAILYASAATTLTQLNSTDVHSVLHGGTTPTFSAVDLTADVANVLPPANGGTGVANTNTITLGGNIVTGGAFTTTPANAVILTTTGATNVTLPTTGTLLTAATGVTSVAGTASQILANGLTSAQVGAVTLTIPGTFVAPGTVTVTSDLTIQGLTYESAAANVAAAAGGQSGATQLTKSYSSVTTSATGEGVKLPAAAPGLEITVVNETAGYTVSVYPFAGDQIDAAGMNDPVMLPAGGTVTFQSVNALQWYTIDPVAVANGPGISVTYGNGQTLFANTGVVSFSAGSTGLTPNTATIGAVTLAGVLNPASGGTGVNNGTNTITAGGNVNFGGAFTTTPANAVTFTTTGATNVTLPTSGTLSTNEASVASVAGTANEITVTGTGSGPYTGAVTVSVPTTFIAPGSIEATTTLMVDGNTANTFLYSNAGKMVASTSAPTDGQLLIGSSGAAPVVATLTGTAGQIGVTNGPGSITLTNLGVTTFSGGTTGLTPASATAGDVVLAGTLVVANGGTGVATLTTNGVVFGNGTAAVGVTAAGTQYQVLTAGSGGVPVFAALSLAQPAAVTGILPLVNGGTNSALTAVAGAVAYSDATSIMFSTAGVAGQALISGGTSAPTWQTVASTLTTNQILEGNGSGAFTANGATFVGTGTFSGVTLSGTVTNATDATTKAYVDNAVAGLTWKNAVRAIATTNGTLATAYAAGQVVDGYTLVAGDRILLAGQTTGTDNGIYVVQASGAPVRATDMAVGSNADSDAVFVVDGTTYHNTGWVQNADPAIVGTNALSFSQFSGGAVYTAGTGIAITGTSISVVYGAGIEALPANQVGVNLYNSTGSGLILTSNGTTRTNTTGDGLALLLPANAAGTSGASGGGGLVQDASGLYIPAAGVQNTQLQNPSVTLDVTGGGTGALALGGTFSILGDAAAGVSTTLSGGTVTNGYQTAGATVTVTVANATTSSKGVAEFDPAYFTATSGTISLLSSMNLTVGSLTDSGLTANGVVVAGTAGLLTTTSLADGQLLIGSTGAAPVAANITNTDGFIGITNGAGSIVLSNLGVTQFNTTLVGLTPTTATSGAVTLAGTLGVASGGTGANTLAANSLLLGNGTGAVSTVATVGTTGQVLVGNTGGAPTWATLSSVGVTSITGTANEITASAATGAVTLSVPSTFVAPGSVQVTTYLYESVSPAVTSAGTDQSSATALTSMFNTVTTVGLNSGVRLPTAVAGLEISIVNFGSNSLNVYPAGSAQIDAAAAGAPIVIPNGGTWTGQADSAAQWYSIDPVTIPGTGISVAYGNGQTIIGNTGVLSFSTGTTGLVVNAATGTLTLSGTLDVANGGTGATTFTSHGVLVGEGTGAVASTVAGTAGQVLKGVTGADPAFAALDLTADVGTSILPSANGGTGVNNSTAVTGTVLAASSTGNFTATQVQYYATGAFVAATPSTITHNLNQQYVLVQVYDTTGGSPSQIIPDSIVLASANTVQVTLNQSLASALVVVVGLAGASNGTF